MQSLFSIFSILSKVSLTLSDVKDGLKRHEDSGISTCGSSVIGLEDLEEASRLRQFSSEEEMAEPVRRCLVLLSQVELDPVYRP